MSFKYQWDENLLSAEGQKRAVEVRSGRGIHMFNYTCCSGKVKHEATTLHSLMAHTLGLMVILFALFSNLCRETCLIQILLCQKNLRSSEA